MISYEKLEQKLKEKHINKSELGALTGLSSRTIAKIAKGEKLSRRTLEKIAAVLDTTVAALCEIKSDNVILQTLREEKAH
jgi:DNA-binding Xre family transcriptional regulator